MARNYKIEDQRQTTDLARSGRFRDVMEISFSTVPYDLPGVLLVPLDSYTPENVDQLVSARAATMIAVHNL